MTAAEIAQFLKQRARWVSAFELSAVTGVGERQLRTAIHDMRISGDPNIACIISGNRGYLWCVDEGLVDNNLRPIEQHARRELAATSSVRRAVRRAQERQLELI